VALVVAHGLQVVETDRALALDLDAALRSGTRGRATDGERAHRELGARLADRLGGDDAHRLADVDAVAARQVAAVALRADAVAGGTGDGRTHHDLVHAGLLDEPHQLLVEQLAGLDQHFVRAGAVDVLGRHAAEHALAEALDHVAALDDRHHRQAVTGAAVRFRDHQVLRHVHEAAREVTRVRGLEGGVRQALARAVRRDEVLQDVQAFAEVRGDRRLDDRAVGLGHQAAHARELADLGRRTARARIRHHVDRVEGLLAHLRALRVRHLLAAELVHHGLGDLVVGARPDVHDLVVALAVGDEAGGVLLLDLLHLVLGGAEDALLLVGHHHVVHADRHARAGRVAEAHVHELVGEHHGLLEAEGAVALVDRARDRLLGHVLVDQVERQAPGQDLE
jgi:hypothetical protein